MKHEKVIELDSDESFLDAYCLKYQTSIVFLDDKLAEIADGNPNKAELLRYRRLLAEANKCHDLKLIDAWLNALLVGLKAACYTIPLAIHGEGFKAGRKQGTIGPIRKSIRKALAKNSGLKNAELWEAIKINPPRNWTVFDNRAGKYIEGPKASDNMSYRSFCNAAAKEREIFKGQ